MEERIQVEEQVKKYQEFVEKNYKQELAEIIRKGENKIIISYSKLMKFDHELADLMLDEPEDLIKAFEIAIEQFDLGEDIKNFKIRLIDLPKTQNLNINEIRSEHLNKLFVIEGTVRQKSEVRPQATSAKFECPQCGNTMSVLQVEESFRQPTKCGCGRKGNFRLISKELVDAQGLVLEESPENLEGGDQQHRIKVILKEIGRASCRERV